MAGNGGFNPDFSYEDISTLVCNAHALKVHDCLWKDGAHRCNAKVQGQHIKAHLHDVHAFPGTSPPFACLWGDCDSDPMNNKDSVFRHIQEQHLLTRWPCMYCESVFTRRYALIRHNETCTSEKAARGSHP